MDSVGCARREEAGVGEGRLAAGADALILAGRAVAAAWGGHYACWSFACDVFPFRELRWGVAVAETADD